MINFSGGEPEIKAEAAHRGTRARCCGRGRRSAGGRRRKRLQRFRRRLRLLPCQLRSSGRGRRRGDRQQPDDENACRVLVRWSDDDLVEALSPTLPHLVSTCSRPCRGRAGRHFRERAWPLPTSRDPQGFSERHPVWTVEQVKSALVQSGVDAAPRPRNLVRPALPGRRGRRAGAGRSAAAVRSSYRIVVRTGEARTERTTRVLALERRR